MKIKHATQLLSILIAGGVVLGLTGCTSCLTLRPYSPPTEDVLNVQTGLVYFLPKTEVDVKVTYSIYEENKWKADVQGNPIKKDKDGNNLKPVASVNIIEIDTAPEIQTVTIPDTNLGFTLDPTDMVRFGVGIKDGKFEVNSDGLLTSAGVSFQDKSLETAQAVVKTGISLAKLAAVAAIEDTVKERKLLKQVVVRKVLDLSDFSAEGVNTGVLKYNFDAEARRYLGQDAPKGTSLPKADLILTLPKTFKRNASANSSEVLAAFGNTNSVHGVVTRIPAKARVQFAVGDLVVADSNQTFAQIGGFALAPISSRRFTEYTTGVSVSPTAGNITDLAPKN